MPHKFESQYIHQTNGGNEFTSSSSVRYNTKNGECQQKVSIQ